MAFKRKGSPYYQVRRKSLPGYGDTGQLTTGVTSKRVADRMERLLEDLAARALVEPSWYALLDAVCGRGSNEKRVGLPDLLAAKNQGRLDALRAGLHDPPLSQAIDELFAAREFADPNVKIGTDMLLHYARARLGRGVRLSDVRDGRTLTAVCRDAERDPENPRKRNSVRSTLLRGVSHLLRFHVGNAERDRTYSDLDFPAEDDTREVHLTPAEIARLLDACDELAAEKPHLHFGELRVVMRLSLQTSADRGTLLSGPWGNGREGEAPGLRGRHVRIFQEEDGTLSGEAFLPDTKNENRPRTVPLTDSLCRELVPLAAGKGPDEPVFSMTYRQMDYVWGAARERAGLPGLRLKDLRSQYAIYGEEAGVPLTVLAKSMGHAGSASAEMTRRYQRRSAALSNEQAREMEALMLAREGGGGDGAPAARPGLQSGRHAGGSESRIAANGT